MTGEQKVVLNELERLLKEATKNGLLDEMAVLYNFNIVNDFREAIKETAYFQLQEA